MVKNRFISSPENMAILEAIVARLTDLPAGSILPNGDLDNLAKGKRYLIARAREIVEKRTACVFATVIRQGIKKLEDESVHTVGKSARASASRKLGRANRQIIGVLSGPKELDNDAKLAAMREVSKLGLAIQFVNDKGE